MAYLFGISGKRTTVTEEELQTAPEGSYVIVLDHGTSVDGKAYWLYLAVHSHLYTTFRELVAQRAVVRFKEYGRILRYGYDMQVPVEVKTEMKEQYGVDEAYMEWLIQDANDARQAHLRTKETQENKRIDDIVAMLKSKQQP